MAWLHRVELTSCNEVSQACMHIALGTRCLHVNHMHPTMHACAHHSTLPILCFTGPYTLRQYHARQGVSQMLPANCKQDNSCTSITRTHGHLLLDAALKPPTSHQTPDSPKQESGSSAASYYEGVLSVTCRALSSAFGAPAMMTAGGSLTHTSDGIDAMCAEAKSPNITEDASAAKLCAVHRDQEVSLGQVSRVHTSIQGASQAVA
jgi:hypothetical protein